MPRRRASYHRSRKLTKAEEQAITAIGVLAVMAVAAAAVGIVRWVVAPNQPEQRRVRGLVVATMIGMLICYSAFANAHVGLAIAVGTATLGTGSWAWYSARIIKRNTAVYLAQYAQAASQEPSNSAGQSLGVNPPPPLPVLAPLLNPVTDPATQPVTPEPFRQASEICEPLKDLARIWYIEPHNPPIWTIPVGAYYMDIRTPVRLRREPIKGMLTGIDIWRLDSGPVQLYFFPDEVHIHRQGAVERVRYADMRVEHIDTRFIEREAIPSDTQVVGRTWLHTTVKGLPDLRYRSNPEIPITRYGVLRLTPPNGKDIYYQLSNASVAVQCFNAWTALAQQQKAGISSTIPPVPPSSAGQPTIALPQVQTISPSNSAPHPKPTPRTTSSHPLFSASSAATVVLCFDQRTEQGCRALNPVGTMQCQQCGQSLRFAMNVHNTGVTIGHYRIVRLIGVGAYGAVYEADNAVLPRQRVALKELFDPTRLDDLRAEFAVVQKLQHPNLPAYYRVFEDQGSAYLVMEFVDGQSLDDVLRTRNGLLVESQVLAYAVQLSSALQYLHEQQPMIVHRDVKPANIRITQDGLIKLVDFGLVKQGTAQTRTARRALTPAYAPLEQYSGGTDPRTDIYGLGATLYHLLTGTQPLPATDRVSVTPDPLIDPVTLNPQLSPIVAAAIMQSLALRQADRPPTMVAFRNALVGGIGT